MSKYHIETFDDLYVDRTKIESEMSKLIDARTKLQNKIRRATPEAKITLREGKGGRYRTNCRTLRKKLKLNKGIEERSVKIQEKTDMFFANEMVAKQADQEKMKQRQKGGWER